MSSTVASNAWAEIVHHASDGILEERWLPGQMTDGAFMASLALLALEAERLRPSAILIDATIDTHHRAAIGTRIGDESAADLFERRREVRDQTQERRLDVGLVALLVRLEPPALVVSLEIPEKAEQTWPEITVRYHGLLRDLSSHLYA